MPKAWCDLFFNNKASWWYSDIGFISVLSSCPNVFRPNKSAGRSDTQSCFRLSGVFTAGTAWRLLLCSHRLYDPSTEQLSRLQLLFEPMQLPSFSPCSRQCAVVISEAEQDRAPWCDTDAPRFFFFSVVLPKMKAVDYLILLSVFWDAFLSLWPKPASELWYRVLLLFLWDN